ncbi:MAG TPA: hypothetical protein VK797_08145, partial [Tepidisphaeraceae bacterium]|nr:hypothetical protein [Tepidisphaeraceae bacterium]
MRDINQISGVLHLKDGLEADGQQAGTLRVPPRPSAVAIPSKNEDEIKGNPVGYYGVNHLHRQHSASRLRRKYRPLNYDVGPVHIDNRNLRQFIDREWLIRFCSRLDSLDAERGRRGKGETRKGGD